VKTGGRLVKHARYYWPLLAESHLTRGGVRSDGTVDGGVARASAVGVRSTGSDFSEEEQGTESLRDTGRTWELRRDGERVPSVVAGSAEY
jgi:hypothetical protein